MKLLTIRVRLFALIGVLLLACVLLAVMGVQGLRVVLNDLNSVYQERVVPLRDLMLLNEQFAVRITDASNKANNGLISYEEAANSIAGAKEEAERLWQHYRDLPRHADEVQLIDQASALSEAAAEPLTRLVGILQRNDPDALRDFVNDELYQNIDPLTQVFSQLSEMQLRESKAHYERGVALEQRNEALVWALLVLAMLIGGGFGWLLSNSINRRLERLRSAVSRSAEGDLSTLIEETGADEITDLQHSFRQMQDSLRSTLQGIQGAAEQLAAAAGQLQAVTDSSVHGIHQQNQEIQMAATAVTQMSTAVEEVAGNANRTSEASRQAEGSAQVGRNQVASTRDSIEQLGDRLQRTSGSIGLLAEQAQSIGKVLEVIRTIAEQTNLLALNAAIEAARAGEQGRGFAVVADEVRALAQRTQSSTQEIERMIEAIQHASQASVTDMTESSSFAERTREMAAQADQALEQIAERISQINEMNLVIASAAEQQAQVAREVDRNLVTISDIATQSATGAQQTSSASTDLARLAGDLTSMARRFRL